MSKEERDRLIKFIKESAEEFGVMPKEYEKMSDEQLEKEADWFDYLWTK